MKPETVRVSRVLGTLISWMAQSANSPISIAEASELLQQLHEGKNRGAGLLERAMELHIKIEHGITGPLNEARRELIKEWQALQRGRESGSRVPSNTIPATTPGDPPK